MTPKLKISPKAYQEIEKESDISLSKIVEISTNKVLVLHGIPFHKDFVLKLRNYNLINQKNYG